jgi:S-layer protein (TIGR01567 family)
VKKCAIVALIALTMIITIAVSAASVTDNVSSNTTVCNVVGTSYECSSLSNEKYPEINLFGEEKVPLLADHHEIWNSSVNKLATLVIDSNATQTLRTGENIDLGRGYTLKVKGIDADSEKVWLEFSRNGRHIADQNISVNVDSNKTWTVTRDNVQGENNIAVMKVHVNQLFVGVESSLVKIDGIWLIDYTNAKTLKIGDKIKKFSLEKIIGGINSSNLGSLIFESITVSPVSCNVVSAGYKCDRWSNERYPLINLFGEKDVPLLADSEPIWKCNVDKLARLVLDSSDKKTLKTGDKLDLGKGYSIQVKEIDIGGKKVWLEFDKKGKYVDDSILSTGENWTCLLNSENWTSLINHFQGEDNVPVLKVHVSDVYQSGNDSLAQIDGIWLIDYANAKTLKIGDEIGEWTLEKIVNGTNKSNLGNLVFKNATDSSVSCKVVGNNYRYASWANERYPSINLFESKYVPLLSNGDPIWKCHVDKLAKLVLDSGDKHTLKTCEKLDLGQGYSILVKKIDFSGKKVWLEFDKNGKYVDDQIISTDENWTCYLDKIQCEDKVPVLKIHIIDVYQSGNDSFVQINGIWLIDYVNAKTFKVGDKIGNFTLEEIVDGTNKSNMGSLVFRTKHRIGK